MLIRLKIPKPLLCHLASRVSLWSDYQVSKQLHGPRKTTRLLGAKRRRRYLPGILSPMKPRISWNENQAATFICVKWNDSFVQGGGGAVLAAIAAAVSIATASGVRPKSTKRRRKSTVAKGRRLCASATRVKTSTSPSNSTCPPSGCPAGSVVAYLDKVSTAVCEWSSMPGYGE